MRIRKSECGSAERPKRRQRTVENAERRMPNAEVGEARTAEVHGVDRDSRSSRARVAAAEAGAEEGNAELRMPNAE